MSFFCEEDGTIVHSEHHILDDYVLTREEQLKAKQKRKDDTADKKEEGKKKKSRKAGKGKTKKHRKNGKGKTAKGKGGKVKKSPAKTSASRRRQILRSASKSRETKSSGEGVPESEERKKSRKTATAAKSAPKPRRQAVPTETGGTQSKTNGKAKAKANQTNKQKATEAADNKASTRKRRKAGTEEPGLDRKDLFRKDRFQKIHEYVGHFKKDTQVDEAFKKKAKYHLTPLWNCSLDIYWKKHTCGMKVNSDAVSDGKAFTQLFSFTNDCVSDVARLACAIKAAEMYVSMLMFGQ